MEWNKSSKYSPDDDIYKIYKHSNERAPANVAVKMYPLHVDFILVNATTFHKIKDDQCISDQIRPKIRIISDIGYFVKHFFTSLV